jgi:membrane protease YdiL (CAAX protease family)
MHPLRVLVIYFAVVLIGGALLAPWLYWVAQAATGMFPSLTDAPFHRFLPRSILLLALAGVWPLTRALGGTSPRDLGWAPPAAHWNWLASGSLIGVVSLTIVAVIALLAGGRMFRESLTVVRLVEKLIGAMATATAVSVVEETLFRGALFGGMRRMFHWSLALLSSSVLYAAAHYLGRAEFHGQVKWHAGLVFFAQNTRIFADGGVLIPGFPSLILAGVLLGLAFQRTGNLYFSVGLHGGWVLCQKLYSALTTSAPGNNVALWGSGRMIDGWLTFVVLVLALGVVFRFVPCPVPRPGMCAGGP